MSGSSAERRGTRSSSAASAARARSAAARASAAAPSASGEQRRRLRHELLARAPLVRRKIVEAPAEPGDDHLGRLRPRHGVGRLAGGVALERREAAELCSELAGLLRRRS